MKKEFLKANALADINEEKNVTSESVNEENSYPLLSVERKNRNQDNEADNVDETRIDSIPTLSPDSYLEPVNRFPIPERPIIATTASNNRSGGIISNIRANPHARLTQV